MVSYLISWVTSGTHCTFVLFPQFYSCLGFWQHAANILYQQATGEAEKVMSMFAANEEKVPKKVTKDTADKLESLEKEEL